MVSPTYDDTLPLGNVNPAVGPATADAGVSFPVVLPKPKPDAAEAKPPSIPWPENVFICGTPFSCVDMAETVRLADAIVANREPRYMVTANVNYLMLESEQPRLREVSRHAAVMLADGKPIVWRSKTCRNPLPERVAGSDLIVELAQLASKRGYRVFFLGGAEGVARTAASELKYRFPDLKIAGCYSPPFRPLTEQEHKQMLARIRDAKTDILLVAFGQPKGEFWIYDNLQKLGVPLSIQLGASFDFLAGTAKRAPKIWQKLGCEWLYRALSDPVRLVPRYAKNLWFVLNTMSRDIFNR
jgi:N-acetylglucosaminyldiphosphoundecaprenol N-acetyl-beta-D-mannosaminyltransferase